MLPLSIHFLSRNSPKYKNKTHFYKFDSFPFSLPHYTNRRLESFSSGWKRRVFVVFELHQQLSHAIKTGAFVVALGNQLDNLANLCTEGKERRIERGTNVRRRKKSNRNKFDRGRSTSHNKHLNDLRNQSKDRIETIESESKKAERGVCIPFARWYPFPSRMPCQPFRPSLVFCFALWPWPHWHREWRRISSARPQQLPSELPFLHWLWLGVRLVPFGATFPTCAAHCSRR